MSRKPIRFGGPTRRPAPRPQDAVLTIERLSHEGRGIGRIDGKTVFVSGALPGEEVKARILTDRSRFSEAETVELLQSSPDRTEPGCRHYGECGGCDLQHLHHARQIEFKQALVLDQLDRLGGLTPETVEPPLVSMPWHYRRSARIGINRLQRSDEPLVGFRRRGSNKLLQIERCEVLDARAGTLFRELREALAGIPALKSITHAQLQYGDDQGALTLRIKKPLQDESLARLQALAERLALQLYTEGDDGIQYAGGAEQRPLSYSLPAFDLALTFAPGDFLQVNTDLNRQMISRALDWLSPEPTDRALDLFCGLGNFTLPLARRCADVVGVEGSAAMVERTRQNADANGLHNIEVFRHDLSQDFRHQGWFRRGFDLILLDPPRAGAPEAVELLARYGARRILYVSCNPAALARDGALLAHAGYRLSRFCVMDMFPHTAHVESLALFEATA